jgi:hypothetical protein
MSGRQSTRRRELTERGQSHAAAIHKSKAMVLKHQESKKQNKDIDELAGLMETRMKFGGRRKRKTRRRSRK